MSRCFPYPPPGYTLSRASNEALIESIKLQKEREEKEKAKLLKKEKKREKKEKKKEKEKRKEKDDQPNKKLHKSDGGKIWIDTKGELLLKEKESQTAEQLERSSLTEEHGQPIRSNAPTTSSDSTETSNKRKRDSSSSANDNRGPGKIIRIKLSSKKQSDPIVTSANDNRSDPIAPVANERRLVIKSSSMDNQAQQKGSDVMGAGRGNSQSSFKPETFTTSRPVGPSMQVKTKITDRPVEPISQVEAIIPSRPFDSVKQVRAGIPIRPVDPVKKGIPSRPVEAVKQVQPEIPSRPVESVAQVKTGNPLRPAEVFKQVKTGIPARRPVLEAKLVNNGISPRPVKQVQFENPSRPADTVNQQIQAGIPSRPVEAAKQVQAVTTDRPIEPVVKTGPPPVQSAAMTKMQRDEMKYKRLFENWSPPQLQVPSLEEDLDWLYPPKRSDAFAEKRQKIQHDGFSCASSSALQPRAQYLKEVDMYALPYTLPF